MWNDVYSVPRMKYWVGHYLPLHRRHALHENDSVTETDRRSKYSQHNTSPSIKTVGRRLAVRLSMPMTWERAPVLDCDDMESSFDLARRHWNMDICLGYSFCMRHRTDTFRFPFPPISTSCRLPVVVAFQTFQWVILDDRTIDVPPSAWRADGSNQAHGQSAYYLHVRWVRTSSLYGGTTVEMYPSHLLLLRDTEQWTSTAN